MADDFTTYVAARGPALWRTAWLLTGDSALAEDLVQTALTKAWPHFARVSRGGSFEAYVRRTMVTTYATWRGRRWHGEVPTAEPPERSTASTPSDPDLMRALAVCRRGSGRWWSCGTSRTSPRPTPRRCWAARWDR